MTLVARYNGNCSRCGRGKIVAGQSIEWDRITRATRHANPAECHLEPTAATQPAARIAVEDAGVYVLPDGSICKVQVSKSHKDRTYAKRWFEFSGTRVTEAGSFKHGEYRFEPGLVQQVAAEGRKMTLAEAQEFTLRYGICVRCGKGLKDAKSVLAAIGPVCVQYFGTTREARIAEAAIERAS